ncbi:MAG: hypothetical protein R3Y05_00440 [bacterium]
MTVYEDQILTLPDFSIVFISETVLAVTQHPDKLIETEKLAKVNFNKIVKKGKSTMGVPALNILVKGDIVYLYILEKRYLISTLFEEAKNFDNINLLDTSKYLMYKKNEHFFVALRRDDFTYINPKNIVPRSFLGPIFYFKNMNEMQYNDSLKSFSRYNVPTYASILDNKIDIDEKLISENFVVFKNDFNQQNNFYFTDDPTINIQVNSRKPIITYGFSRNNSKNYFDVNISNTFENLKNYIKADLNYNKNYFNHEDATDRDAQLVLRSIQLSLFLPILFVDFSYLKSIPFDEGNILFKTFIKYLKLRQRFIPFLYSSFKNTRYNNVDSYIQNFNQITVNKQLLIIPIHTEIDPYTNQTPLSILFDDVCYDFISGERYEKERIYELYAIDEMPIFALPGSIIPLFLDNVSARNKLPLEYEIKIYPGANKEYTLYYDEYIENNVIKQSITTFDLKYKNNNLLLKIKTNALESVLPTVLHLNFINIKKDSSVRVNGTKYNLNYKTEDKILTLDIFEINNNIEIEIINRYGLEISRKQEFLEKKLYHFFNTSSCTNKEKIIYKYKVKPFLHEPVDSLMSRINKHTKFIPAKQRKNIQKIIEMYKKD